MNFEYRKNILLTGAGFTANFGGLLSRDVWHKIFNDSRLISLVNTKLLLRNEFNFENVYSEIIENSQYSTEQSLFQEIILSIYEDMDKTIQQENSSINGTLLNRFLDIFLTDSAAWFTLNQDRYFERYLHYTNQENNLLVPASMQYNNNISDFDSKKITPTVDELNKFVDAIPSRSWYVKLHGSIGWYSENDRNCMVLGVNKPELIKKEPLLKWYFDQFNILLNNDKTNMLIIGYSFLDKHINRCILNAIGKVEDENYKDKLKLHIISPEEPSIFRDRLRQSSQMFDSEDNRDGCSGTHIWNAIESYFPYTLDKIFPNVARETDSQKRLNSIFFTHN